MNRFTSPIVGAGHLDTYKRFSPYWNDDVARCEATMRLEVGDRVMRYLDALHSENQIGSGYDYMRRICVIHTAREAFRERPEPTGQLTLAGLA